ncbi:MAG: NHLP bacteriocin system secretion protein [Pseudomonadota bacterium]
MTPPLFRKEALDAVERSADVQHSMRVTGSATRIATAALVGGIALALVWSFFVQVPIHVPARGVLVYSEQTLVGAVKVPVGGFVKSIKVQTGDKVSSGDVIAVLNLPDRLSELEEQRLALEEQLQDNQALRELRALDDKAESQSYTKRKQASNKRAESLRERLKWLDERIRNLEILRNDGIVTPVKVAEARILRAEVADKLADVEAELITLAVEHEAARSQRERAALEEKLDTDKLADRVARLAKALERDASVLANSNGRIVSIDIRVGDLVTAGDVLAEIEPIGSGSRPRLEAVAFIRLQDGKQVGIGDPVRVAPADLPISDQSRLLGTVRTVTDVPVSNEALAAEIGDDAFVSDVASSGPTFAARIALDAPDGKSDDYKWSSTGSEQVTLSAGTPITARITVDHVRLMALAIPAIHRLLEGPEADGGSRP